MKAKIYEIFQSIQGEGKYVGVPQVFVRFFECNMRCDWCDTPHSIGDTTRRYDEYTTDELMKKIEELWDDSHSVSLTGGEPLIQTEIIKTLLPELRNKGMASFLETNGIYFNELKEVIDDIDIISMDIKLPSSTKCRSYWEEHRKFLDVARQKDVYVKTVVTSDTAAEDIEKAIELVGEIDPGLLFIIQPNSFELSNGVMKRCMEFERETRGRLNNVRILPQMHRIMKIR